MPKYVGSDSEARLSVLREIAHETGATANQVVIAWMLQSDPPVLPIIGASTQEQLTENMNALTFHLSAEQMARLQEAGA